MRQGKLILGLAGVLLLAGNSHGGDSVATEIQAIKAKVAVIKHTPEMQRWLTIPWLTDLNEGIRTARAEKRPILLWVTGDDPLGRC